MQAPQSSHSSPSRPSHLPPTSLPSPPVPHQSHHPGPQGPTTSTHSQASNPSQVTAPYPMPFSPAMSQPPQPGSGPPSQVSSPYIPPSYPHHPPSTSATPPSSQTYNNFPQSYPPPQQYGYPTVPPSPQQYSTASSHSQSSYPQSSHPQFQALRSHQDPHIGVPSQFVPVDSYVPEMMDMMPSELCEPYPGFPALPPGLTPAHAAALHGWWQQWVSADAGTAMQSWGKEIEAMLYTPRNQQDSGWWHED